MWHYMLNGYSFIVLDDKSLVLCRFSVCNWGKICPCQVIDLLLPAVFPVVRLVYFPNPGQNFSEVRLHGKARCNNCLFLCPVSAIICSFLPNELALQYFSQLLSTVRKCRRCIFFLRTLSMLQTTLICFWHFLDVINILSSIFCWCTNDRLLC